MDGHMQRLLAARKNAYRATLPAVVPDEPDPGVQAAPQAHCQALSKAVTQMQARVHAEELAERDLPNPLDIDWLLDDIKQTQQQGEADLRLKEELEEQQKEADQKRRDDEKAKPSI